MTHGIDILVPQRGKLGVARGLDRFAAAGIRVHLAADADTLELLDDKAAFANSLAGDPYLCPTRVVTTAAAFEDAVSAMAGLGGAACVKPRRGVYGAGYWTLDADRPLAHLADPDARRIAPEVYAASLRRAEELGEPFSLLVMEYLPGQEASVDIVADRGAVMLAAARIKLDANRQRILTRHALIAHATGLVRRHGLHGAINVQYKQDRRGEWRILEINARAAGGASYCDEVGIPFCTTWIDAVMGKARPFTADIDAEIIAVTRAERRVEPAIQKELATASQA
ncbi:ATP-grasp domain-containing protein [Novosphingobium sp. H3SJ31-1]|uniref:ATP-grasp domain-containing protein n=1 Tax=Novosphingobium album (ex Liu et al. 2023) TaxID=3031130 RepID=A0ABT5WQJ9_9SPHN|nr:ATP-grasp domain-containing protein [Novosphingobium album (ex Liu et al. 2023)]